MDKNQLTSMPTKTLALIAVVAGIVAVIAVFLPWYSVSMEGMQMPAGLGGASLDRSQSYNGTEGEFLGVWILILSVVGAAAAGVVFSGRKDLVPLPTKQLLLVAAAPFALATILALVDVLRDTGGGGFAMGQVKLSAGRSIGVYLTFLAVATATAATAFAALRRDASPQAEVEAASTPPEGPGHDPDADADADGD